MKLSKVCTSPRCCQLGGETIVSGLKKMGFDPSFSKYRLWVGRKRKPFQARENKEGEAASREESCSKDMVSVAGEIYTGHDVTEEKMGTKVGRRIRGSSLLTIPSFIR